MVKEEMKELLKLAWKDVFKTEEAEDDADFFEAGGDSIMAVQLSAWLLQKGVKLELQDVFATSKLGDMVEKLTETTPFYVPNALLTKEIAANEMQGMFGGMMPNNAPTNEQEQADASKLPEQQVCSTPFTGNQQMDGQAASQQVCTPDNSQQVCSSMNNQEICNQQICSSQQMCMPMSSQQVCMPQQMCMPMGSQQVCMPQQICMPMNSQQVCMPMGNQQMCMPMGNQQMCMPMGGNGNFFLDKDNGLPPQLQKYVSKEVDAPIENPNVIKIEKAKVSKPTVPAPQALEIVMNTLMNSYDKEKDLFEQGLTSLDTVKMVTRCGENGYSLSLKDIYKGRTFDAIVDCMVPGEE